MTCAFAGIPNAKRGRKKSVVVSNKGKQNEKWLSVAKKRVEMLCHPCILGHSQRQPRGAKNQQWSDTRGNKIRNGCLTPSFSVVQNGVEMLRHPCLRKGAREGGNAASPLGSRKGGGGHGYLLLNA